MLFAIAKEEIPLWAVLLINSVLVTTEWCSAFDNERDARMDFDADRPLASALLIDGNRSALLEAKGKAYGVPLGDLSWSDNAIVELSYLDAPTGTAAETPRTVP